MPINDKSLIEFIYEDVKALNYIFIWRPSCIDKSHPKEEIEISWEDTLMILDNCDYFDDNEKISLNIIPDSSTSLTNEDQYVNIKKNKDIHNIFGHVNDKINDFILYKYFDKEILFRQDFFILAP